MSKNLPVNGLYRCKHCFRVILGIVKFAAHKRAAHPDIYGDPDPESSQSSSDDDIILEPSPSPAIRYRPGPKCKKPMLRITEPEPAQVKQRCGVESYYNYVPPELITIDDSSDTETEVASNSNSNLAPSSVNQSSTEELHITTSESDPEVVANNLCEEVIKPEPMAWDATTATSDLASTSNSTINTDRPMSRSSDISWPSTAPKSDSEATVQSVSMDADAGRTEESTSIRDVPVIADSPMEDQAPAQDAEIVPNVDVDQQSSAPDPAYQCESCPRVASSQAELLKHQRIHKQKKKVTAKKFVCRVCQKRFIYAISLGRHMISCHRKKTQRRHSESSASVFEDVPETEDETRSQELLETDSTTSECRPRVRALSEPSTLAPTPVVNMVSLSDNSETEQEDPESASQTDRQRSREVQCKHCRLLFPTGKAAKKHSITCRRASKNLYTFLSFFKSNISPSSNFDTGNRRKPATKASSKRTAM